MPEYRYATYNNQHAAAVQFNMDQMSRDGWHVHTCLPNYTEFSVLWERALPGETVGFTQTEADVPAEGAPAEADVPAEGAPAEADVPADQADDPAASILGPKAATPPLPPG